MPHFYKIYLLYILCRSYAERLGCGKYDTSEEILQKLRTMPASKLTVNYQLSITKNIIRTSEILNTHI